MTDLLSRVAAIAARVKATDPRREVVTHCPTLVAWLAEWHTTTGAKATLLRAWDGTGWEYKAKAP